MSETDLVAYYSRRAAEYERIYLKPERQADLAALTRWLEERLAGHDILEVACGTGYWTERLAPLAKSIVATDASPEVLEIARRKPYPVGQVRIEPADAFELETVKGHFTAAFAGFWWSHMRRDEIALFLGQLHARLSPGAHVVFTDNRNIEGSSTPISRVDTAENTYQTRRLEDGSEHEILKNFPTPDELRATLHPMATSIEITELTYFWCASYRTR